MLQTEKKWLAAQDPAQTLARLQAQLDRFGAHYNRVRPHRALNRHTPTEIYLARPKAVPTGPLIKSTTGSATIPSTTPAASPCATTADSTTSASAGC